MLLGNFFNISEKQVSGNTILATIEINAQHPIFEGHFPDQPIVPGVCMIQMIQEITEIVTGKKLQLSKADQLKFLAVINPLENPGVNVEFTFDSKADNSVSVNGKLYKGELNFLKFKGSFIQVD
nr:(3R)-hydroxymyristoyl-[ACP] dehydratase [uncultured bacterium]